MGVSSSARWEAVGGRSAVILSRRRAQVFCRLLARQHPGLPRGRLVGRGKTSPIASNQTEAGRERNRRVEITIYH